MFETKTQLLLTFKKEQWIEYNQCIISIDFITSLFQVEANIVFHTLMSHLNYVLKKIKYTIYQTLQIFLDETWPASQNPLYG